MPPARRRSGAKQDAANTAVEDTTTEAEATEGDEEGEDEDKPKTPRVKRAYTVKEGREDLANELVGDDFDEISAGDPATGEMLEAMRANKAKWDSPEEGSIKYVFDSNSAIPLRSMLNKYTAENTEDEQLTLEDADELYELLVTQGAGWEYLAARTGESKDAVKAALKDKVMAEQEVDITEGGHAYGKGENWTWVSAEALLKAKEENGNGDDAEEPDEDEGEEDEESTATEATEDDSDEDTPPTRRRRRAPAA